MVNKITTLLEFKETGQGLTGFRQSVAQAEGATGKFKAGWASAVDSVKANAANLALAGGAALVAFGVKSVQSFTDGALAAGKFSDASGLAVEDASRWQEVAGDLGISTDTIAAGVVKLERAIATGGPAVKELGIEVVKTADGQADMNETMLDAIERLGRIKDPADRAKAATELFGRGFADMAEIVNGDADEIRKRLEGVADAQVFDQDEVDKARRFRDAMENLQDSVQALSLAVGERLAPALADAADAAGVLGGALGKLDDKSKGQAFNSLPGMARDLYSSWKDLITGGDSLADRSEENFTRIMESVEATRGEMELLPVVIDRNTEAMGKALTRTDDLMQAQGRQVDNYEQVTEATEDATDAADDHADAIQSVTDAVNRQIDDLFSVERAEIRLQETTDRLAEAHDRYAEVSADANATDRDKQAALIEVRSAQLDTAEAALALAEQYAREQGAADGSAESARLQKEELIRLRDEMPWVAGEIQRYIDTLNRIPQTIHTNISGGIVASGGGNTGTLYRSNRTDLRQHEGGIVGGRQFTGMAPDEVAAVLRKGETTLTPPQLAAVQGGGSGGLNIAPGAIVIQSAGPNYDARKIIDALTEFTRRGGRAPW